MTIQILAFPSPFATVNITMPSKHMRLTHYVSVDKVLNLHVKGAGAKGPPNKTNIETTSLPATNTERNVVWSPGAVRFASVQEHLLNTTAQWRML